MPGPIYKYALAVLLVAVLGAPAVGQTTEADALYQRALTRLHSLPQQPYIEYTMSQTDNSPDGKNPFALVEVVIERRVDRTSWNIVQAGDMEKNGVVIGRHFLIPDMFLRAGPIGATSAEGAGALPQLDVIATVGTRQSKRYDITLLGEADVPNFGHTVHLGLHPTGDPEINNVRELWIRTSDAMLYKARYKSKLFDVRHTSTANQLDVIATLNEDGLVTSWTSTGWLLLPPPPVDTNSATPPPAPLSVGTVGDGTFTRYLWKQTEPDFLFDDNLWSAYVKHMKTTLKASPSPKPL